MDEKTGLTAEQAALLVAQRVALLPRNPEPPLVGLNGAQGSGKSTLARLIVKALRDEHGLACAVLSLDDFYLSRADRQVLAATVHPLCATRGVAGTHDVALLARTLAALQTARAGETTAMPGFDKLADDRLPQAQWSSYDGRPDVLLLEGWCVGLRRADLPPWSGPINALEAEHDADGRWRAWAHAALANYEPVWDRIDLLASIEVPGWETVITSRLRQEHELAAIGAGTPMDRAAITRFVEHYERHTRALWPAMRKRADVLLRRDDAFRFCLLR